MAAVPVSPPNYFSALGVKRRFGQNKADLESRFYRLSRELHPDRFATGSADERRQALEKMSLVNEAYGALKDPVRLRDYFLKLVGVGGDAKAQIPVELAESWFELQEVLMEDPVEGQQKVEAFKAELLDLKEKKQQDIQALETGIDCKLDETSDDVAAAMPLFQKLATLVRDLNYLDSMERDVERIRGKRNVG
ncbi:MAG: Fe-S protein assembly co-chaperone HscB [Bdellovibrionia bacterium]